MSRITERLESAEDLVKWAKAVNLATNNNLCDLQDVWGRSSVDNLHKVFNESFRNSDDRGLVVFAIQKAMGAEAMLQMVESFAKARAQEHFEKQMRAEEEALEEEWKKVVNAQGKWQRRVSKTARKLRLLYRSNKSLNQTVSDLRLKLLQRIREVQVLEEAQDEVWEAQKKLIAAREALEAL